MSLSVFNTYNMLFAVTIIKRNEAILSYIRFMAKYYNYNVKIISRFEKFKSYMGLLSGPTFLVYSHTYEFELVKKINKIDGCYVIFFAVKNIIILSNHFSLDGRNDKIEILSNINKMLYSLNTHLVLNQLIFILNAYSKSIIKRK